MLVKFADPIEPDFNGPHAYDANDVVAVEDCPEHYGVVLVVQYPEGRSRHLVAGPFRDVLARVAAARDR